MCGDVADSRLKAALDAIVDREPIDVNRDDVGAGAGADDADLRLLRALHAMAPLGHRAAEDDSQSWPTPRRLRLRLVAYLGVGLALLQLATGLIGFSLGYVAPRSISAGSWFAALAGFAVSGTWLTLGGRGDARARALGGFYLLVGASFSLRFLPTGSAWMALLPGLSAQPFLPFFLWAFAERFPRTVRTSFADRVCHWALNVSAAVALSLLALKIVATLGIVPALSAALERYYSSGGGDFTWGLWYWAPPFALLLPVAPVIVAKRRLAPLAERRRATVFVFGFGVVLVLAAGALLLETFVPSFFTFVRAHRGVTAPMFIGGLLAAPFITTYAVLVDNVLDVRTALTRGARYLLARYTLLVLSATPLGLLIAFLYLHRSETIGAVLSEGVGLTLVVMALAGALLTALRDRAMRYLDTHFDRTPVNLAEETVVLTAAIGDARTAEETAAVVDAALTRCLNVAVVRILRLNQPGTALDDVSGEWPSIADTDALYALLCVDRVPVVLDGSSADIRTLLPTPDRQWCEHTGAQMLVPVCGAAARPLGALAIGSKTNGDQLHASERTFVGAVAAALAMKLGGFESAAALATQAPDEEAASVCNLCAQIAPARQAACHCGGRLRSASIPRVLAGKFAATSYVGAGAMGVVYRAVDSTLNRTVALKTLGRLNVVAADRLAAEARMMAAVAHPNLATIYGIERWRNAPILVLEFLERGTLASRLRSPLPIDDVLRLGILLAPALDQLHKAQVLHRDIKPTNIGFTRDDAPKLLDFGLASFLAEEATAGVTGSADAATDASDASRTQAIWLGSLHLAGTPLYLPPEALDGAPPSASFDLWALSLVLFEAIAGRHPFAAPTVPDVLERVRHSGSLDLRRFRSDCPPVVATMFSQLLAHAPRERCRSATELRDALTRALAASTD